MAPPLAQIHEWAAMFSHMVLYALALALSVLVCLFVLPWTFLAMVAVKGGQVDATMMGKLWGWIKRPGRRRTDG